MTISELITKLESVRAEHGELRVFTSGEFISNPKPEVTGPDWDCEVVDNFNDDPESFIGAALLL